MDQSVVARLAFIRYLHQQGVEQATGHPARAAAGLLAIHDAVELFLVLAGEAVHVDTENTKFMKLWGDVNAKWKENGKGLTHRAQLDRLNTARNAVKHRGSWPSDQDLKAAVKDSTEFLGQACQSLFGCDYASIDMADLVTDDAVRRALQRAQEFEREDELILAAGELAYAMDLLVDSLVIKRAYAYGSPGVRGTRTLKRDPWAFAGLEQVDRRAANQIEEISEVVRETTEALQLVFAGVNYPSYLRFRLAVPHVSAPRGDARSVYHHQEFSVSRTDYDFCREFVISTFIQLANNEFSVPRQLGAMGEMVYASLPSVDDAEVANRDVWL